MMIIGVQWPPPVDGRPDSFGVVDTYQAAQDGLFQGELPVEPEPGKHRGPGRTAIRLLGETRDGVADQGDRDGKAGRRAKADDTSVAPGATNAPVAHA